MKKLILTAFSLSITLMAMAATAQVSSQVVVTPGSTVTTTVQAPGEAVTTKVTTTPGQSVMGMLKDGKKVEMDSDGSVYLVYADGARVTAPDGMHTLMDGTSFTVKDGKRIP